MEANPSKKLDIIWDMETGDPDDFFTLLLLLGHPKVNLKAITITPGSTEQVGLVRKALNWFERDIPIGAYNINHTKTSVSTWHYKAYGPVTPSEKAEAGYEVLQHFCDAQTTLVTGAPLKNLGKAIQVAQEQQKDFSIGSWVAQGGFAGEGVVPPEKQLPKFKGLVTCPTYNLNGDPKGALAAVHYDGITQKRFVSKNVCHGVYYNETMHEEIKAVKENSLSLELIWKGMEVYLQKNREGKKFHDPLAACCAIDESIGNWAEVELYRENGQWGSRLSPGSNTWIIWDYNREKFLKTLTDY